MKIKNNKKNILETLLYLGCQQAAGLSKGEKEKEIFEEEIVLKIFKVFESKKVKRAREGTEYLKPDWSSEGLGYWSGISVLDTGNPITDPNDPRSKMFYDKTKRLHINRGVRTLLQYGESRCGEWTDLLLHLFLTQGIKVSLNNDKCAICTDFAIVEKGFTYGYRVKPHNSEIKPLIFTVKNAILESNLKTKGDSHAQGNKKAQPCFLDHVWVYFRNKIFLDPSYGKIYTVKESTLEEYCKDNISSVLIENKNYQEKTDFANLVNPLIAYNNLGQYMVCSKKKPVSK